MDKRFSILAVDDEPVNIELMRAALKDDYEILTALSGQDAVDLLEERIPDLILLDVMMPEVSGYDVCRIIKADERLFEIPVIFLTSLDSHDGELQGLELGGIDYLTKPTNFDLLKLRIRNQIVQKTRNDLMKEQVVQLARQKEELAQMLSEQKLQNKLLLESDYTLKERMKELNCIYLITAMSESSDISLVDVFKRTVELIPPAWQFPEITVARILFEGELFQTECFRETSWMQSCKIMVQNKPVGKVDICYLEERRASDEVPFISEECLLLNAIAEKLGHIIERNRAETALLESNTRFDQLAEQSDTVVWEIDTTGLLTYISHVSEAVFGYHPDEVIGKMHFYDMHPESVREAFKEKALAIMERKVPLLNVEHTVQAKDGHIVWVSTTGIPQLAANGVLLGYCGSDSDITDRKRADDLLQTLSRVVEQSPVTIMITDTNGTIEFVNPKYTELTGYSYEETVGQNPRILKSGRTPPETYQKLWSTLAAGETWEGEFVNKRKDGSIFYEYATISPLCDDNGVTIQYVAVKEDITEKKSVMEQLIHSQKMESIGQLAGGLAHDLNNILCVINGYAALVKLDMNKDQEEFDYINTILKATSRAASLTRSLLAYSRKQEMHPQNQNLNTLIETFGSFVKRIIHENIEFTFSAADVPLTVYVDTVQIEQIILNFATNARDAMPQQGGTFSIATSAGSIDKQYVSTHGYGVVGDYAVITVSDTGCGMDAETQLKVFDPFFTTKEVGKGTGLGLSMVMGIIKQHRGFVDVESEPGKGTVFHLYLPLVKSVVVVSAPEREEVLMEKASGTIMIVEDDESTRAMLEDLLTRAGYTVIAAVDGQDAVEKFAAREDDIQLVISDVVMPRKSGKAACDEIRLMSDKTKVLFVSGHTYNVIEREVELGADAEVIVKPVMPFELLSKIRELLNKTD